MRSERIIVIIGIFLAFAAVTAFAQTSNTTAQERRVVELINIERARQNLPPLILHDTLASIARAHSEDMLQNNSVRAARSDGTNITQMILQGGITSTTVRNILVFRNNNSPEQRVVNMMGNASNRELIMSENHSHIGIGIIQRPQSTDVYWTFLFVQIPPIMTPSEIREFEMRVMELTNIERAKHSLPPLLWHDGLADVARAHSADLMRNNLRGHTGSDGSTVRDRIERSGITNTRFRAENCNYGQTTPDTSVQAWMNSPGHRANILNESATHLGVGFVQRTEGFTSQYVTYWTQVFAAFR